MKLFLIFLYFSLIYLTFTSETETNRHFCYHLVNEAKDELDLQNSIKKYFKQMKDDSPYCI